MKLAGKRIVFVLPRQGYREEEFDEPQRAAERAGGKVLVAGSCLDWASGLAGGRRPPDLLLGAVRADELDGLLFVGGYGASEYFADRRAHALARAVLAAGKPVGAICYAVSTLAAAGLLEGVEVSGHPDRADHLRACGALLRDAPVTRSGSLLTGRDPAAARPFAAAWTDLLAEG